MNQITAYCNTNISENIHINSYADSPFNANDDTTDAEDAAHNMCDISSSESAIDIRLPRVIEEHVNTVVENAKNRASQVYHSNKSEPLPADFEMCICNMQEYIFSNSPISLSPSSTDCENSDEENKNPTIQNIANKDHHILNSDCAAKSFYSNEMKTNVTDPNISVLREALPPISNRSFLYRQFIGTPVYTASSSKSERFITPKYSSSPPVSGQPPFSEFMPKSNAVLSRPSFTSNANKCSQYISRQNSELSTKINDDEFKEHTENSDIESTSSIPKQKKYKKLTYDDVEKTISKYYIHDKFSTEFDILITYIRGKKNLYIQSKNFIQIYLNVANIIIIFLTAGVAVISPLLYNYEWSSYLIMGINSIITILFGLYNYLKLESTVDNFYNISNQYNNLETSIEMTSNKLYFIKDDNEKTRIIIQKIEYLEEKLKDINDNFTMIIPELVKQIFPVISHINVFMFIKKIEAYKFKLIMDLCNIKNEIRYITYKYNFNKNLLIEMGMEEPYESSRNVISNKHTSISALPRPLMPSKTMSVENTDFVLRFCSPSKNGKNINTQMIRIQKRLQFLLKMKKTIKDKIYHYKNTYGYIDEIFNEEIANAEHMSYWFSVYFNYAKISTTLSQYKHNNPIMEEIMKKTIHR